MGGLLQRHVHALAYRSSFSLALALIDENACISSEQAAFTRYMALLHLSMCQHTATPAFQLCASRLVPSMTLISATDYTVTFLTGTVTLSLAIYDEKVGTARLQ